MHPCKIAQRLALLQNSQALLIFLIIFPLVSVSQFTFSIKITFNLDHKPGHIYVANSVEKRMDTLALPSSGILEYKGQMKEAGIFQLKTDSSNPIQIWVDDKAISFNCSDERTKNNHIKLVIKNLIGSDDTKLLYQMTIPRNDTFASPKMPSRQELDSISHYWRYTSPYKLIDSLLLTYPESPILPFYLYFYKPGLGPEVVGSFYDKLPGNVQTSEMGLSVKKYLDRSVLLQKGTIFENFVMLDDKRKELSLSSISAKYILIDFWASWCGPCRAENPQLLKLYNSYKEKGFEIVSISFDANNNDWLSAIKKDELSWKHVSDLKGRNNKVAEKYKVSAIPFSILLDNNYKVIASPPGAHDLQKILETLLN